MLLEILTNVCVQLCSKSIQAYSRLEFPIQALHLLIIAWIDKQKFLQEHVYTSTHPYIHTCTHIFIQKIYIHIFIYIYIYYKPWLIGLFRKYIIQGRGRRKFIVSIKPKCSEGFVKTANFRRPRLRVVYSQITPLDHGSYVTYYNDDVTPLLASRALEENLNLFETSILISYGVVMLSHISWLIVPLNKIEFVRSQLTWFVFDFEREKPSRKQVSFLRTTHKQA